MNKLVVFAITVIAAAACLRGTTTAHGGTFRGPSDSVAPGGGGGAAPSGNRGTPQNSGGGGGGLVGATDGSKPVGGSGSGSGPNAAAGTSGGDTSTWQTWWGYNRDPYLDLRQSLYASDLLPGGDDFFLGRIAPNQARDRLRPSDAVVRARIVPALRKILSEERDNDVVTGALIALAKIGDPVDLRGEASLATTFASFLGDANQEIAETAAVSLGVLASESALPILRDLVLDTERGRAITARGGRVHWRTRAFAAYGMGLIGFRTRDTDVRRDIVRTLTGLLEGEATTMSTPDVGVACITALGLSPLPIEADYMIASESCPVAERSLQAQIDWCVRLLADESVHDLVRAHVPTAVARLCTGVNAWGMRERVVQALIATIATHSRAPRVVRASAVLALGRIGDADGDPLDRTLRAALLRCYEEAREPDLEHFSLMSLAHAASRAGPGAGEPWQGTREAQTFLLGALQKATGEDRSWIAITLGIFDRALAQNGLGHSPQIGAALRAGLVESRSPRDIGAFAVAAGVRMDAEARALVLAKFAETADDETRGFLCIALGLIGERDAMDRIQDVVRGARYRATLLRDASVALGILGDKSIVPELAAMLRDAKSLSTQAAIASALGTIGDARSIDPLIAMLENKELSTRARAFAAVALGIVGDKETFPWNSKLSVGVNYRANTTTLFDGQGAGILEIL